MSEGRGERVLEAVRDYSVVAAFVLLFIALSLTSPHFLTTANLVNTIESGAIYGIVAVALTLLLIVGEFDLSVGAVCVLAGIVAAVLQPVLGAWPALACGVLAALAAGLLNGFVVAFVGVNSFVATLASSLMIVGLGTRVTDGAQIYIADPAFTALGNGKLFGIAFPVWIFLAVALACGFVLSRTRVGQWLYAIGGNSEAARLLGIDTRALRIGAFMLSGLAAGLAGAVLVSRTGTALAGNGLGDILFPAIAAVVVGGTSILGGRGAVWRTVLGVLLLEVIRNGLNLLEVDAYFQDIVRGAIILAAVSADAVSRRPA